jgi:hypothetical protein
VVIDPIRDEPIIPGGHMKWDESPQETVVREVREETGLDISVRRLVEVYSGAEWAGERGIVRIIYEGAVIGGSLVSSAEGEARWWSAGSWHTRPREMPLSCANGWLGKAQALPASSPGCLLVAGSQGLIEVWVLVRGQELTPALGEIRGVLAITSHLLLDQLDQSRRPIVACLVQHGNGSRPQLLKFWLPRALLRIIFAHRQRDGHRGASLPGSCTWSKRAYLF